MSGGLAGRRVVVVGASAGIGRALAGLLIDDGAHVVAAARRTDRLAELVARADGAAGTCVALPLDLGAGDGCRTLAEHLAATEAEGVAPVDVVFSSAGVAPLAFAADTAPADWDAVFRTNVIGLNELVRTALPHLSPTGVVAALSSETVDQPRQALTAYGASKAALEALLRGWRIEEPRRRFTCVRVGATQPTEFGDGFDMALLGPVLEQWMTQGLLQQDFMDTEDVAAVLVDTLATLVAHPGVAVEELVLRSPSPVVGSVEVATRNASPPSGRPTI